MVVHVIDVEVVLRSKNLSARPCRFNPNEPGDMFKLCLGLLRLTRLSVAGRETLYEFIPEDLSTRSRDVPRDPRPLR